MTARILRFVVMVLRWWTYLFVVTILFASVSLPAPAEAAGGQFFPQTGFSIKDTQFLNFFNHRGGLRTFGYPVSREFKLLGYPVQIFQRAVMQRYPDGHVQLMNLLDDGLFPYTQVNGAVFPAADPKLTGTAPTAKTPNYSQAILSWISKTSPDKWNGIPVAFHLNFLQTVSPKDAFPTGGANPSILAGFDLEIWGIPTSLPAFDPHNKNFVYQRFQRGILHYDASKKVTEGILLADYFKNILTGRTLPADLRAEARTSPFYEQYNASHPGWVARPGQLPNTDLTLAFEPTSDVVLDPGHGGKEIGTSHTFPDGTVITEKDLNLTVAKRTAEILQQAGIRATLTRTTDSWVDAGMHDMTGNGQVGLADDLQERIDLANRAHAALFLSIHFNGSVKTNLSGTTVYYDSALSFAKESQRFASLLDQETVAALHRAGYNSANRGVQTDTKALGGDGHFYVLGPDAKRPITMPSALVEGLFLTNDQDARAVRNPKVVDALAQAYSKAIELYLRPQK